MNLQEKSRNYIYLEIRDTSIQYDTDIDFSRLDNLFYLFFSLQKADIYFKSYVALVHADPIKLKDILGVSG